MVSPNFRPNRENFRRKFSGPKIALKFSPNFGENLTQIFRDFSRKISRPTKKKIRKKYEVFLPRKIAISRFFG